MYSWSLSWISWCLVGASEVRGCNLCFSLLDWAAVLDSGQQGAVLNEVSVSAVTFCPLRLMGTAAVLSGGRIKEKGGEGREREQESESGRRKDKDFFFFLVGWRARVCIAHHNSASRGALKGWKGSWWIYVCSLLPVFYISIVFGQAPLYMCNYHWHCYFFQTQVQALLGWLVCFVSPGHS